MSSRIPHNKITPPNYQNLYNFYIKENHSCEECAHLYKVHPSTVKSWLRLYGIKKDRKLIVEKRSQTNIIRYGGKSPSCDPSVMKKVRETNLSRYGGVAPMQNREIFKKAKKTLMNRYGVLNTWDIPEVRARQDEIIEKTRSTNLSRYGKERYEHTEEYKQRVPELVKKAQKTHLEKYGVPVYTMSEDFKNKKFEIQKKREKTNLLKYGQTNFSQTDEFRHKVGLKYWFNGEYFDSSWELALWIYAKDHNEEIERVPCKYVYFYKGKQHFYYPDFKYKGLILELKGDFFFNQDGNMISPFKREEDGVFLAKQKCMLENNVTIWTKKDIAFALDYVTRAYGKDFLKKCKR